MEHPTVLIISKDDQSRGGVANYFRLFFQKFDDKYFKIIKVDVGSSANQYYRRLKRPIGYALDFVKDLYAIRRWLVKNHGIRIVHVNPSMIPLPLIHDGIILLLAKVYQRKVVVFFRGWRDDIARKINYYSLLRKLFIVVFGQADRVIVLANDFRQQLIYIGINESKILVSKTMFDGEMIQTKKNHNDPIARFLYLSRISREKGAFETIEAAKILKERGFRFGIKFHGHGATDNTIPELKLFAKTMGVSDRIKIGQFLEGAEKFHAYSEADVFLLPSHHEGCPNSVLEAMGSGCFIICTGVGALKEVVHNGQEGMIVRPGDAVGLAEKMSWAIHNAHKTKEIGQQNMIHAFRKYESKSIIRQIVAVYKEILYQ